MVTGPSGGRRKTRYSGTRAEEPIRCLPNENQSKTRGSNIALLPLGLLYRTLVTSLENIYLTRKSQRKEDLGRVCKVGVFPPEQEQAIRL